MVLHCVLLNHSKTVLFSHPQKSWPWENRLPFFSVCDLINLHFSLSPPSFLYFCNTISCYGSCSFGYREGQCVHSGQHPPRQCGERLHPTPDKDVAHLLLPTVLDSTILWFYPVWAVQFRCYDIVWRSGCHEITKWLKLEETSQGHLLQFSCSRRTIYNRLTRTMSRWLLNLSKDADCTHSLSIKSYLRVII